MPDERRDEQTPAPARPRILHLAYNYFEADGNLAVQIVEGLRVAGPYEVWEAYLFDGPKAGSVRADDPYLLCLNLKKRQTRRFPLRAVLLLRRICREHGIDAIVTHRFRPARIAGWLGWFHRFRRVVTVFHGLGEFDPFERRLTFRLLLRNAIKVGVSEAVRRDLIEHVPGAGEDDTVAIDNALDLEKLRANYLSRERARRELGLGAEEFVIGSTGRLVYLKGYKYLIQAFSDANIPESKLLIIGASRGSRAGTLPTPANECETEVIEQIATLGLQDRVVLAGRIDNASRYARAFDCFVLPSLSEAFGLVLLEAMAAEVPCIGTICGGIPHVLGDAAPLVPMADSHALQQALEKIHSLSAVQREEMGRALARRAEQHFALPRFQRAYAALFRDLR